MRRGRLDFALCIKEKPETLAVALPWGWDSRGHRVLGDEHQVPGTRFDIHGGGMDLQATQHTNEIAQSEA